MSHWLHGTEIGDFPKSGFEHLRVGTLKRYGSQTDYQTITLKSIEYSISITASKSNEYSISIPTQKSNEYQYQYWPKKVTNTGIEYYQYQYFFQYFYKKKGNSPRHINYGVSSIFNQISQILDTIKDELLFKVRIQEIFPVLLQTSIYLIRTVSIMLHQMILV